MMAEIFKVAIVGWFFVGDINPPKDRVVDLILGQYGDFSSDQVVDLSLESLDQIVG